MKKLVLGLLLALSIAGCKKSDPASSGTDTSTMIMGNWRSGTEILIYFSGGKEVYRKTNPAAAVNAQYSFYYTFKAGNIMDMFEYNTSKAAYVQNGADYNYVLSNSGQTLTYSQGSFSTVYQITFPDNNTMTFAKVYTGTVAYSDGNNVSRTADSYSSMYTFTRF